MANPVAEYRPTSLPVSRPDAATQESWQVVLRIFFGVLLLWAAVSKIGNPTKFLSDLIAYRLPLPNDWLKLTAAALPWVELLCGVLLLAGAWMETALTLVVGLFGVFAVSTGQAWWRSLPISCGCFDLKMLGLDSESSLVKLIESPGFGLVRSLALLTVAYCLGRSLGYWSGQNSSNLALASSFPTASFPEKPLDRPAAASNKRGSPRRRS